MGGLYKDSVYLEGAVKILTRRNTLDFHKLMCGKVSLDDYGRKSLMSKCVFAGQLLPPFM